MKVLFLDIDGVLNSEKAFASGDANPYDMFAGWMVEWLNWILAQEPELKIVISSSWRTLHPLDEGEPGAEQKRFTTPLRPLFNRHGIDAKRIIDITPSGPNKYMRGMSDWLRGWEIQTWLDNHPEVTNFVILDDSKDMAHLLPHLVRTTWKAGLKQEHAEEVVRRLRTKLERIPNAEDVERWKNTDNWSGGGFDEETESEGG